MEKQNSKFKTFRFILFAIISFSIAACNNQAKDLKSTLQKLSEVPLKTLESDSMYTETYELWYTQNVDHENDESEEFNQQVIINHVGFDRPTIVILEGYDLYSTKAGELSKLLNANQITIEHRFFDKSRPDSIPWEFLNIKQAATDQHNIIQSLKSIYSGKWISTGISKGGQTTMYHRRFFPNDVDASVAYVAPFNFEREDPRIAEHLNTVGTKECRDKVLDFQTLLFEMKSEILPLLKERAQEKEYTFNLTGIERAYDLNVLEYSFAFWQWSGDCDKIPESKTSVEDIFKYWISISSFSWFSDQKDETDLLFTYQALSEIGFYDYDITPFRKYLEDSVNITFDYKIPSHINYDFNAESMQDIKKWIQKSGDYMLYIYGENDPWAATAVNPSDNTIAVKMVNPDGNHRTRIKSFPDDMKDSIYDILENWSGVEIVKTNNRGGNPGEIFEIL
ncbi:MAG: peptidase [Bacteroidales bacterium]|nr:peptidase [Bacteroidales bacterium]